MGDLQNFIVEGPRVIYWNCNPYGMDFSPDGKWLAFGCGGNYGNGGIAIVDIAKGELCSMLRFSETAARRKQLPGESFPYFSANEQGRIPSLTVSGIAFDASGKYLAASTWQGRSYPAMLFRVEPDAIPALKHCVTFTAPENFNHGWRKPTGLCFSNGKLVVRWTGRERENMVSFDIPKEFAVDTNVTSRHRSHARIAAFPRSILCNQSQTKATSGIVNQQDEVLVTGRAHDLVTASLGPDASYEFHPVIGSDQTITAILALPPRNGKQELITGGREGVIMLWRCAVNKEDRANEEGTTKWEPASQIRCKTVRQATVGGAWAAYEPQSIVALCALDDGRFFSADASGEVLEWAKVPHKADWTCIQRRVLPRPGTPRCMAVHPQTARGSSAILAVGVKAGDGPPGRMRNRDDRPGFVVCYKINTTWDYIGQFILMRSLVDQGRAGLQEGKGFTILDTLMAELDPGLFRMILSFLIPRY